MSRFSGEKSRQLLVLVLAGFIFISGLSQLSCSKSASPAAATPGNDVAAHHDELPPAAKKQEEPATKGIATAEEVKVAKPENVPPPYHNVFVLSIGINANPAYKDLHFAVSDAEEIAKVCGNNYGFTNVTLLTDTNATRENVLAALDKIRSRLSPDHEDDFIFYFSGHGDTLSQASVSDNKTNIIRHGFLVTYYPETNIFDAVPELQAHLLEMTMLATNIAALPARHRLMFIDSCFSGLAFVDQTVVDKQPDELYREVIEHPTVQIMTAGLDSEKALEDPNTGHGVFTDALLRQLRNPDIMTMEEVFFPLRVKVRHSLEDLDRPMSMSPQHRYFLYQKGTFIFVPLSKLSAWGRATSDNAMVADLGSKGYFRPVTINEVTNLQSAASYSPEKWQDEVDRYETRAAMGDPYATMALAQIYNKGIGVKPNPDRARLYTAESSDFITAGHTLNFAGLMGITNELAAVIVNGLIQQQGPEKIFHFGGNDLKDPVATMARVQEGAKYVKPALETVKGWFKRDPMKGIFSSQEKIMGYLAQQPTTTKNINRARKELSGLKDDIEKLGKEWPEGSQPPEVQQLLLVIADVLTNLEAGKTADAKATMEKVAPLATSLKKIVEGSAGGG